MARLPRTLGKAEAILQLRHITKTYPGVVALDDVTIDIARSEVHALVGENGAGKSTLIKICTGAVAPDSGTIIVAGRTFSSLTPSRAGENGIAAIYQDFNLVDELSVAENVFLGRAIRRGIVIDRKAMADASRALFDRLGIPINPNALVKNLSVAYRQVVEIAKAVSQNARILIMDEPTAPLTSAEVERLFALVDALRAAGVTIVYVSHRLDEVVRLSDRVTVIRDGRKIDTLDTKETDANRLVRLMVGRELKETYPARTSAVSDELVLDVRNLHGNGLSDVSFAVRRGEVLGVAGLIGAGRTELAELIFGVKPRTAGTITFKGKQAAPRSPGEAIRLGIGLVPEDRKRQGVVLPMNVTSNISLAILKRLSFASVLKKRNETRLARRYCEDLRIRTPSLEQAVGHLSGGNQQKVVVAKWLAAGPDLIILDEPTRGIDVGARHEIYGLINGLVEGGKAVLMISSEMEELLGMADRIVVLSEGRIAETLDRAAFDQERIMRYASGTPARGVDS